MSEDEFTESNTPAEDIQAAIDRGDPVTSGNPLRITRSTFPAYGQTSTASATLWVSFGDPWAWMGDGRNA